MVKSFPRKQAKDADQLLGDHSIASANTGGVWHYAFTGGTRVTRNTLSRPVQRFQISKDPMSPGCGSHLSNIYFHQYAL
jgi:hypothetical protein